MYPFHRRPMPAHMSTTLFRCSTEQPFNARLMLLMSSGKVLAGTLFSS